LHQSAGLLARFEAISARFSDFPAPDINSKGQRSYCATRSYFLLAALLHVQKLRPAKRVVMTPLLLLPSQITDFHFVSFRFVSQITVRLQNVGKKHLKNFASIFLQRTLPVKFKLTAIYFLT